MASFVAANFQHGVSGLPRLLAPAGCRGRRLAPRPPRPRRARAREGPRRGGSPGSPVGTGRRCRSRPPRCARCPGGRAALPPVCVCLGVLDRRVAAGAEVSHTRSSSGDQLVTADAVTPEVASVRWRPAAIESASELPQRSTAAQAQDAVGQDAALEERVELVLDELRQVGACSVFGLRDEGRGVLASHATCLRRTHPSPGQ